MLASKKGWPARIEDHPWLCCTTTLQVEYANVLVMNKGDLVSEAQAQQLELVLRKLNPSAQVCRATWPQHFAAGAPKLCCAGPSI